MPQTCRGTGITIYTSSKSGCGTGSKSSNCPDLGKQHVQCNLQQAVVANLPSGDLGAAERQAAESLTCTAPLQARKAHLEELCLSSWLPQYSLSTQRILFTKRRAARCKRQAQKKIHQSSTERNSMVRLLRMTRQGKSFVKSLMSFTATCS